jgi:hypothetical protein
MSTNGMSTIGMSTTGRRMRRLLVSGHRIVRPVGRGVVRHHGSADRLDGDATLRRRGPGDTGPRTR